MVDLPADDEGLSWIVSRDPTKLLLIPGLQPSSIAAAAAGDQQALAFVRFTAQHFAAHAGTRLLSPLDKACLAACKVTGPESYDIFFTALQEKTPQLARIFEARQTHTQDMLDAAASEGRLSAMKWIRAICPRIFYSESSNLMDLAAKKGHLAVLRYLGSGPNPKPWNTYLTSLAAPHLDCIKWLLSAGVCGGYNPCSHHILSLVAECHGLAALQWLRAHCNLSAGFWNITVCEHAADVGDHAMLEWLRAQSPPVPWGVQVCGGAAARGDISMLSWARNQRPPAPWGVRVTAAAADDDVETLKWLRAQDPPCPWDASSCKAAVCSGCMDTLIWLRGQDPPCPFSTQCTSIAAAWSNLEVLQWLHARGCPLGPSTARMATFGRNVTMLKWLQSVGCPPSDDCIRTACQGDLATFEWLCDQGCQLTGKLYYIAARGHNRLVLGFLHRKKVPFPAITKTCSWSLLVPLDILMFLVDIGMHLPVEKLQLVEEARRAHCTFHGLIRWCRQAISDPSKGSHHAFDAMAEDGSGQLLLTRLCMLPPELISKIALSAHLQHDICPLPSQGMQR